MADISKHTSICMRVPSGSPADEDSYVAYCLEFGPYVYGRGDTEQKARAALCASLADLDSPPVYTWENGFWVPAMFMQIGPQIAATIIDHDGKLHELLVDDREIYNDIAVSAYLIAYNKQDSTALVQFTTEDTQGNHRCWVDATVVHSKPVSPKQVRVGVSAVVFKDSTHQEVLLGLRKGSHAAGTWAFPGGHQEFGESPDETAVRETKEETDLDVKVVGYSVWTNTEYPEEGKQYITLFLECELLNPDDWDKVVNKEPEKCLEWLWFDKNWMPTPLMPCIPNNLFPKEQP